MAKRSRGRGHPRGPKGHPTVGRRKQMAAARARARRRRRLVRLYWVAGVALFFGVIAFLVMTGIGASPDRVLP